MSAKLMFCHECKMITPRGKPCECVPTSLEALVRAMEDRAAKYGTAAAQPLGVEMGPNGEKHTRTNRLRLEGMSGGLNLAAEMLGEFLKTRDGGARS